jgi:hypothetical protein
LPSVELSLLVRIGAEGGKCTVLKQAIASVIRRWKDGPDRGDVNVLADMLEASLRRYLRVPNGEPRKATREPSSKA